jgi:hypothetical protein
MQSASEKLKRKLGLKAHLAELAAVLGRPVGVEELGTPQQAVGLRDGAKGLASQPVTTFEMPFADRMSERFRAFVAKLHAANPSPIYVWIPTTIDCGAILLPSVVDINFGFDFEINDEGILSFVTADLADRLLLDLFVSSAGDQRMRVEIQGANWTQATY